MTLSTESIVQHLKHPSTVRKTSRDKLQGMLRNTISYCIGGQISFTHISRNGDYRKQQGWTKTKRCYYSVRSTSI